MKRIEDSQNGQARFQFGGKVISDLSETTLTNTNGKEYKVVTVEFTSVHGEIKQAGAAIYAGNYNHPDCVAAGGIKKNQTYLCTATIVPMEDGSKRAYIQMSHLLFTGGYADADDFAYEEVAQTTTAQRVGKLD